MGPSALSPRSCSQATSSGGYACLACDRSRQRTIPDLRLVLAAVLAGGHVLLEDLPGLGKTLAARSFAQTLGLGFRRLQFTPDLLPADVTGSFIYDQRRSEFDFRPGPLFTNLLLADEVNRTPPRTQAALLEAMQERQVTVEGVTRRLDPPFIVLATANPIEYEGTYQLPEAQLDRFLLRVSFGYLEPEQEWQVISRRIGRRQEEIRLGPVTARPGCSPCRRRWNGSTWKPAWAGIWSSLPPRPAAALRYLSARHRAARSP